MISYREANKSDNFQLIQLTADGAMEGEISLRIDRNPDFFKLLELRGESKVFIAEDQERIIGAICVSSEHVYIRKELRPVHYIGDFKVAKKYRNKGVGMNLTNMVAKYLLSIDADLVFINVSKGNKKPNSFFTDRSIGTDLEQIGIFKIYQFIGKRRKDSILNCKIESSKVTDDIISFLQKRYRKYEMGDHVTREKLENTNILTMSKNNKLIGVICLCDTMDIKQNIVTNVSWKLKFILKLINIIGPTLGYSRMPVLNEPVKLIYVKYLAIEENEEQSINMLINFARNIVYEKSYSFLSVALHEKDPLGKYFNGRTRFAFDSVGMLTSLKGNTSLVNQIKAGIPVKDYSLV